MNTMYHRNQPFEKADRYLSDDIASFWERLEFKAYAGMEFNEANLKKIEAELCDMYILAKRYEAEVSMHRWNQKGQRNTRPILEVIIGTSDINLVFLYGAKVPKWSGANDNRC